MVNTNLHICLPTVACLSELWFSAQEYLKFKNSLNKISLLIGTNIFDSSSNFIFTNWIFPQPGWQEFFNKDLFPHGPKIKEVCYNETRPWSSWCFCLKEVGRREYEQNIFQIALRSRESWLWVESRAFSKNLSDYFQMKFGERSIPNSYTRTKQHLLPLRLCLHIILACCKAKYEEMRRLL